jgi:hypothetical protein
MQAIRKISVVSHHDTFLFVDDLRLNSMFEKESQLASMADPAAAFLGWS